jgi:PST family polysaccharide transporter
MAFLDYGVWALVWANMAYNIFRALLAFVFSPKRVKPLFALREARDLLSFGIGNTLTRLTNIVSDTADNLVIGKFLGPQALGLYLRAYQLMNIITNKFSNIMNQVLFPAYSEIQSEQVRIRSGFLRVLSIATIVCAPVFLGVSAISEPLVVGIFGPVWKGSVFALQVFAAASIFRLGYQLCDTVVRAKGAVYRQFYFHLILALLIVFASIFGVKWGIGGVAIGIALCYLLMQILMFRLVVRIIGITYIQLMKTQIPGFLCGISFGVISYIITQTFLSLQIPNLLIVAAGLIIPATALLILSISWPSIFIGPECLWILNQIDKRFPSMKKIFEKVYERYHNGPAFLLTGKFIDMS